MCRFGPDWQTRKTSAEIRRHRDDKTPAEDLLSLHTVFKLKVLIVAEERTFIVKFYPHNKEKNAETGRSRDGVFHRLLDWNPSTQTGTSSLHGLPNVHALQTSGYPSSVIPLPSLLWHTSPRSFGFLRGSAHQYFLRRPGTGGSVDGGAHHDHAELLGPSGQLLSTAGTARSAFERSRSRVEEAGKSALWRAAQSGQGFRAAKLFRNFSNNIRSAGILLFMLYSAHRIWNQSNSVCVKVSIVRKRRGRSNMLIYFLLMKLIFWTY